VSKKGGCNLKIAISTDGDFVSEHFGRCPSFTLLVIEDGMPSNREVVENPGHEPGRIPKFLYDKGVECIICGGMGMRAAEIFKEFGIKTIVGVSGKVDETVEKILEGSLAGGESFCSPGAGKGYGVEKSECGHEG
jgi:predicted Fe-Mo cluster-binding NifX family protein